MHFSSVVFVDVELGLVSKFVTNIIIFCGLDTQQIHVQNKFNIKGTRSTYENDFTVSMLHAHKTKYHKTNLFIFWMIASCLQFHKTASTKQYEYCIKRNEIKSEKICK